MMPANLVVVSDRRCRVGFRKLGGEKAMMWLLVVDQGEGSTQVWGARGSCTFAGVRNFGVARPLSGPLGGSARSAVSGSRRVKALGVL
jgi:hypothetical protein